MGFNSAFKGLINHSAIFTVLFLFSKHSQWTFNTSSAFEL